MVMVQMLGLKSDEKPYSKDVIFDGEIYPTSLYFRKNLDVGNKIDGPSVVIEPSATTLIPPDFAAEIDPYQNIIARRK